MVLGRDKLTELIKSNTLLDNYDLNNIKSASYDLRIGTIYKDKLVYSKDNTILNTVIEVEPSEIITFLTLEIVKIPLDCVGTVFAINKMSSKGFLILNPGHIDPGYIGPLTICAINLSKETINLSIGQSIFTLIINQLDKELNQGYGNNIFIEKDRKIYEIKLYQDNFSKLSNSLFDLINNHKELPNIIGNIIKERRKKMWIGIGNYFVKGSTILRGIYTVGIIIIAVFSVKYCNNEKIQVNKTTSSYEISPKIQDSLDKLNNIISIKSSNEKNSSGKSVDSVKKDINK